MKYQFAQMAVSYLGYRLHLIDPCSGKGALCLLAYLGMIQPSNTVSVGKYIKYVQHTYGG